MAKESKFPVPGFKFLVSIDGEDYSFKEVSGLKGTIEFEKTRVRGSYRYTPKDIKYENVVLKRGYLGKDAYGSSLKKIMDYFNTPDFLDSKGYAEKNVFKPVTIIITLQNEKKRNGMFLGIT